VVEQLFRKQSVVSSILTAGSSVRPAQYMCGVKFRVSAQQIYYVGVHNCEPHGAHNYVPLQKNMNKYSNQELSSLFSKMATSLLLDDEKKNMFRILAYKKAAETISTYNQEFYDLWKEEKLTGISGIGKGITALLNELFTTGHAKDLEEQIAKYPESVYFLQNIRGIGPKTALVLSEQLKIKNYELGINDNFEKIVTDKVIQLCKEHKIASLPGFGEKSETDILNAVQKYQTGGKKDKRINLFDAIPIAEKFIDYMKTCKDVEIIEVLGSLRRKMETVGDIDLAATSKNPESVIKHFASHKYAKGKIEQGENKASFEMPSGLHVDLRVINPDQWGSMLAHFTGSKEHNVALREYAIKKGMSISEWGIKMTKNTSSSGFVIPAKAGIQSISTRKTKSLDSRIRGNDRSGEEKLKTFKSEQEFYKFLGLQYIPPELRENRGEIEEAINGKLPKLIELQDIKGDLHMHTNFDVETSHDLGSSTPEEMIEKAIRLKYQYIAFSEHNPSMSKNSKTQKSEILKRKQEMVDKFNLKYEGKLHVFNSLEVDILPDGNMAIEEEHAKYLDFIVASVHSSFEQDKDKQTKRILKALSFPKVKVLGHPTGRLVQKRESISFDFAQVFEYCAKHKISPEISASPFRNDLRWDLILSLKSLDLRYIIDTDSHEKTEMDLMKFGVWNARKGWLTASQVINTWSLSEIKDFLLKQY
jgi:DNA polymerase (family X)